MPIGNYRFQNGGGIANLGAGIGAGLEGAAESGVNTYLGLKKQQNQERYQNMYEREMLLNRANQEGKNAAQGDPFAGMGGYGAGALSGAPHLVDPFTQPSGSAPPDSLESDARAQPMGATAADLSSRAQMIPNARPGMGQATPTATPGERAAADYERLGITPEVLEKQRQLGSQAVGKENFQTQLRGELNNYRTVASSLDQLRYKAQDAKNELQLIAADPRFGPESDAYAKKEQEIQMMQQQHGFLKSQQDQAHQDLLGLAYDEQGQMQDPKLHQALSFWLGLPTAQGEEQNPTPGQQSIVEHNLLNQHRPGGAPKMPGGMRPPSPGRRMEYPGGAAALSNRPVRI